MLGMGWGIYKLSRKKNKCERCQLYYNAKLKQCSHCGGLTEAQFSQFLEKQKRLDQGSSRLGGYFLVASFVIVMLITLVFLH